MYILNAKSARNKVEVSHFAFIASIVPAALCTVVLLAAYGGSAEGRVLLFGTSGLLGWTQTPGLVLVQVVTSVLGDMVGNFGFYLLLKYISPLVVSLASLTVPLLTVVEGLMLGVVSPPGILFGIGAFLILTGAGTASMVTLLPHTEVFDATDAVKTTNEGVGDADKSPVPGSSLTSSPALGYGSVNGRGGGGGKATSRVQSSKGELRPLLSLEAEDKKAESGSPEQPSLLFK
ncbi:Drug/Metabolite transporter superfamily [Ectocarpus siliculosus]|uniref:Drug/Metabolite transporter superfamily n=1 Tax=Ectocarpus siliculosus TaxID=2880 RepID=D7FND8_ECTSI|nr:Drug/Metabolite transporter superfamily [Ectocarpus siliculosus]|eukprot:CBJ30192.1 Drug/Metabolite transporter superfamily [Ectocarpus siliculosus]